MSTAETGHPAWCDPQQCFVTEDKVRVHQQVIACWEDSDATEGVRFVSQLLEPSDDDQIYLDLHIQCLPLRGNSFSWVVSLDTARALRDQLTAHLDSAATGDDQ